MVDPFQVLDNNGSTSAVDDAPNLHKKMNEKDSVIEETFVKSLVQVTTSKATSIHNHSNDIEQNRQPAAIETENNDDTDAESTIMGGHSSNSEADLIVLPPPSTNSSCSAIGASAKELINHVATVADNCAKLCAASTTNIVDKGAAFSEQNIIKNNLKQLVCNSNSISCVNTTATKAVVVSENHNDTTNNDRCDDTNVCSESPLVTAISSLTTTTDCADVTITADNVISSSCTVRNNNVNNSECLRTNLNCSSDDVAHKVESQQPEQQSVRTAAMMDENNHSSNSPTSTTESPPMVVDNRKVEPLKINLHRDPIILKLPKLAALTVHENSVDSVVPAPPPQHQQPAIPKITIKQIPKPSSSHTLSSANAATTGVIFTSDNAATTQNNISRPDEYKVTIRFSNYLIILLNIST